MCLEFPYFLPSQRFMLASSACESQSDEVPRPAGMDFPDCFAGVHFDVGGVPERADGDALCDPGTRSGDAERGGTENGGSAAATAGPGTGNADRGSHVHSCRSGYGDSADAPAGNEGEGGPVRACDCESGAAASDYSASG